MNLVDKQLLLINNWKKETTILKILPNKGLAVARMAAHITYLSKKGLQEKFGRKLQEREDLNLVLMQIFKLKAILDIKDQFL